MKSNVDLTRDRYFSAQRILHLEDYEFPSLLGGPRTFPWTVDSFFNIDYSYFSKSLFFPWLKSISLLEENLEGKGHCLRCGKRLRPWDNFYDLCRKCNSEIDKEIKEVNSESEEMRLRQIKLDLFG